MPERKTKPSPQHQRLAQHLTLVLADSYLLYHTTQLCHWNIVGKQFRVLHELFEEQYRGLAEAIDEVAERIRTLGFYTPGTLGDYVRLSCIEQPKETLSPDGMLEQLIAGHESVVAQIQRAMPVARQADDDATQDLLIERLRAHEKASWILKSQAGHESARIELRELTSIAQETPKLAQAGGF